MFFYIFASIAVLASIMMVLSHNPVRAVLSMVLAFVSMAGIWMLLEAEFLAVALILVYVGAVMVLFLFVVMMLDIDTPELKKPFGRQLPLGIILFALMFWMLGRGLLDFNHLDRYSTWVERAKDYSNVKALGTMLYTDYVLPFEVAGVILLVAMIAAIGLAFRGKRSLSQNINAQVQVSKADRLTIIKQMGK